MITKKCEECGKEFQACKKTQRFCKGPHKAVCTICGKEFEYGYSPLYKPHTCSKECAQISRKCAIKEKYGIDNISQRDDVRAKKKISNASEEAKAKSRATSLQRYGAEHPGQSDEVREKISSRLKDPEVREKIRQHFQETLGVDHIFQSPEYRQKYGVNTVSQRPEVKQKIKDTLARRYGVTAISNIPGVAQKAEITRKNTMTTRYGANTLFATDRFKEIMQATYGAPNPSKSAELLSKAARNKQNKSNLEKRLHNFLDTYSIKYQEEYSIKENGRIHSFDIYLPKYKILVDCDGSYWHAYMSDPDGSRIRDDGDAIRLSLVPHDHVFLIIVEHDFERGLRVLQRLIQQSDEGILDYNSDLFKWCREVGFPYHNYTDERLKSEWDRLKSYNIIEYNENCTIGIAWVNQYHRSIYDAKTANNVSPREAWEDDKLLKAVIANRIIYRNDIDPSKVLNGFGISKIAPRVSVFNPILAKYIVQKYLSEFDTIFDPFSGFSGRLLGSLVNDKKYIGQDLLQSHVDESNQIIRHLQIVNPNLQASVVQQDILLDGVKSYPALFTCPPYNTSEIYGDETVFKTCDDWIDVCLNKYRCKRYVFVVDKTSKYVNNVVEELKSKSHFRRSSESIIVIDR